MDPNPLGLPAPGDDESRIVQEDVDQEFDQLVRGGDFECDAQAFETDPTVIPVAGFLKCGDDIEEGQISHEREQAIRERLDRPVDLRLSEGEEENIAMLARTDPQAAMEAREQYKFNRTCGVGTSSETPGLDEPRIEVPADDPRRKHVEVRESASGKFVVRDAAGNRRGSFDTREQAEARAEECRKEAEANPSDTGGEDSPSSGAEQSGGGVVDPGQMAGTAETTSDARPTDGEQQAQTAEVQKPDAETQAGT